MSTIIELCVPCPYSSISSYILFGGTCLPEACSSFDLCVSLNFVFLESLIDNTVISTIVLIFFFCIYQTILLNENFANFCKGYFISLSMHHSLQGSLDKDLIILFQAYLHACLFVMSVWMQ